jgi:pimeloyl-ACP methyl ester carboxylesterase
MSFEHDGATDHTFTLSDGRTLGYSELGDPGGYPILNNHGGLVCRLDVEPAAADARRLGIRLIAPDRPGVATSDRRPGRDTLDWADDVTELLDGLGVGQLATMGWSMGGQYALAVAHQLGERVTATAVIAGCPPLDDPATFAELNKLDRAFTELSRDHPAMARTKFAALRVLEDHLPGLMAKLDGRKESPADRTATHDHADFMGAILAAGLADADGVIDEYLAWVKPWRFELSAIGGPVAVWQGGADTLVPPAWGARLAAAIPGATLHELPDEGHLIAITHRADILADLLTLATAPHP